MANNYKVLGQIEIASNTLTNVYSSGSNTAVLNTIYVTNQTGANANVDLVVRPTSVALANQHFILKDYFLPRAETIILNLNITMNTNVIISANNKFPTNEIQKANVSVSIFGAEVN